VAVPNLTAVRRPPAWAGEGTARIDCDL